MPLGDSDLKEWLNTNNRKVDYSIKQRFAFMDEILDGLEYLVKTNIAHADLKEILNHEKFNY